MVKVTVTSLKTERAEPDKLCHHVVSKSLLKPTPENTSVNFIVEARNELTVFPEHKVN